MTRDDDDRRGPTAALPASLVAVLGPPAAWAAWVSWADGKASDAAHVAWFLSVALTTLAAGAVIGPAARLMRRGVALLALASALSTLWLWWSSADDSGLFAIGFALWVVPFLVAAPVLVGLGARLAGPPRSTDAPARSRS